MIIHDSSSYRIEWLPSININRPYALDHKGRSRGRVSLNNLGWYETASQAYQARNEHMERRQPCTPTSP